MAFKTVERAQERSHVQAKHACLPPLLRKQESSGAEGVIHHPPDVQDSWSLTVAVFKELRDPENDELSGKKGKAEAN
jgi:phage pi2 protein 07